MRCGKKTEKYVIDKMSHKNFMSQANAIQLRQRDLSQIFEPVRITLLQCAAKICETTQRANFTLFNFYCDNRMSFGNIQGYLGVANNQVLQGLTPNGGALLRKLR